MKMRSKLILIVLFILIVLSLFSLYKISEFKNSIHQTKDGSEVTSKIQKQAKNNEPISIALFGVDSNKERAKENTGQRTDTIILASIDPRIIKQNYLLFLEILVVKFQVIVIMKKFLMPTRTVVQKQQ